MPSAGFERFRAATNAKPTVTVPAAGLPGSHGRSIDPHRACGSTLQGASFKAAPPVELAETAAACAGAGSAAIRAIATSAADPADHTDSPPVR